MIGHAEILTSRAQIVQKRFELTKQNLSVGFVPTMGALHEGHAQLLKQARAENDFVVLSIFVNPKQFGPQEDLSKYPRTLANDVALAAQCGVDCVFAPNVDEVYPLPFLTRVSVSDNMTKILCGQYRDGHFDGVCTVVQLLLNLVMPHKAYFGLKDFQQFSILRKMCADLGHPAHLVGVPTVRSEQGLALSSRNTFLSAQELVQALAIPRSLAVAAQAFDHGETSVANLRRLAEEVLESAQIDVQYLEFRKAYDLALVSDEVALEIENVTSANAHDVVLAFAGYVGKTRLIDNVVLSCDPGYRLEAQKLVERALVP